MKIIKKPTFPIQKCPYCLCEFSIKPRDLKTDYHSMEVSVVICPCCKHKLLAKLNKKEQKNERDKI